MTKILKVNNLRIKSIAFTLAEVLIVLGIIGVIGTLTLPNLSQSTNHQEKVAKLRKVYSDLNNAFDQAVATYGNSKRWCTGLSEDDCEKRHFERITEFMKYSKKCSLSTCTGKFDSNGGSDGMAMRYGVILADGTTVNIEGYRSGRGYLMIDLDGLNKGANKAGIDYFQLTYGPKKGVYHSYNTSGAVTSNSGSAKLTQWVIRYGNMDYLKCSGLEFDKKTTCD